MMTTKWTDAQKEHLKDLIAKNPNMSVREIALKFIEEDPTRTVEAVKSKFRELQKQEKELVQEEPVVEPTTVQEPEPEPAPTPETPAIEHLTEAVPEQVADPTPVSEEVAKKEEEIYKEVFEEKPVQTEAPKEGLLKKIINWLFK